MNPEVGRSPKSTMTSARDVEAGAERTKSALRMAVAIGQVLCFSVMLSAIAWGQSVNIKEFEVPHDPREIVAGPDGALWFTEQADHKIGRMTTAGVVTACGSHGEV